MQPKILLASILAIGASAYPGSNAGNATDIAPALQARIAQLDLGYQRTTLLLNHLKDDSTDVTAENIIASTNQTVSAESNDLSKGQPTQGRLSDAIQLTLCQSYHSLALHGVELNGAFVDNADGFNKFQRKELKSLLAKCGSETRFFFNHVVSKALPYCLDTVIIDNNAIMDSLNQSSNALKASDALI